MEKFLNSLALGQKYAWIPTLIVSGVALCFSVAGFNLQRTARIPKFVITDAKLLNAYGKPAFYYGVIVEGQDEIEGPIDIAISTVKIQNATLVPGIELASPYSINPLVNNRPRYFQKEISKNYFDGTIYFVAKYSSKGKNYESSWKFLIPDFRVGGTGGGELSADIITEVR